MLEEQRRIYYLKLTFNCQPITKLTITSHYEKKHSKAINDKLIIKLAKTLDGIEMNPRKRHDNRGIYLWDKILC